jgi:hypothetical protein
MVCNTKPMSVQEKLDNWFSYHPPIDDQAERYAAIRAAGKTFAETIIALCPESADRTVAVRKIREAVYAGNASIACGGQ